MGQHNYSGPTSPKIQLNTARCSCSQLKVTFSGNPLFVAACHCENCQIRTGSVMGLNAYFADSKVTKQQGKSKTYSEQVDSGRTIERCFCPNCGTAVFWKADFLPGFTGVAAGCFADGEVPAPSISAWSCRQKPWITLPAKLHYMQTQELDGCSLPQLKDQEEAEPA